MVLSFDPEASWLPLGLKHTEYTVLLCPVRVRSHAPVDKDHILMVLSADPEASWLPLGLKHTEYTALLCPVRLRCSREISCVCPADWVVPLYRRKVRVQDIDYIVFSWYVFLLLRVKMVFHYYCIHTYTYIRARL